MAGRLRDWFQAGVYASIPAATAVDEGALYYATDTDVLYRSDGSSWTAISSASAQITTHEADTSSAHVAEGVDITDAGGHFTGTDVEAALQELGARDDITALDDIADVNAPSPTDGQVLSWDDYAGEWVAADGSVVAALDDLTDVDAPLPNDGDALVYNDYTGAWEPSAVAGGASALDDLTDVNAPAPTDGQVVTWDDYAGEWVAADPTGGGGSVAVQASAPSTPSTGDLWYDTDDASGGQGYPGGEGTSFPSSPTSGDTYRRTDIDDLIFRYDGTRWLSEQVFRAVSGSFDLVSAQTDRRAVAAGRDMYLMDLTLSAAVNGTNDGSNYWTITAYKWSAAAFASLGTVDTSAESGSLDYFRTTTAIDAVATAATCELFQFTAGKTGSPGTLLGAAELTYRLIAT